MTESLVFTVDLEVVPGKLDALRNHVENAVAAGATLHGSPSPELRELLTGFGARFHSLIDGNFR